MPLYPFMVIAGGLFLRDFISKPNTARALLLLLVLMAVPLKEVLPEELLGKSAWLFRWYLAIGVLPFSGLSDFKSSQPINCKSSHYTYIFFIMMNIYIVYRLSDSLRSAKK